MAKPETTACWYKGMDGIWMNGKFHCWGTEAAIAEGDGCYSVGIIEKYGGEIITVEPSRVHFGGRPDV